MAVEDVIRGVVAVDKIKKCLIYCVKRAIAEFKETYPRLFSPRKQEEFDAYVESLRRKGGCRPGGGCCG